MSAEEDEIIARLKQDFLEDTTDRLDSIETTVDRVASGMDDPGEGVAAIRREAHTIKGLASSFGFPLVSVIAHRLEDFIAGVTGVSDEDAASIVDFTSWMREIIDSGTNPSQEEEDRILRTLPQRVSEEFKKVVVRDIEVMIVTATKVQAHFLERELQSKGIRVIKARSAVQAFEMAVHCRPNAVISAAVLEGLSGVDLMRAFAAMKSTGDRPLGLMTSFGKDHPDLADLPESVSIIPNRGKQFADELAEFLTKVAVE